ncbi:MAG: disulfide bond formation protein DsbA, partial [Sporomusaceae bacterium]|nr:disulfide bond formation protein DsbA [Sporomusaceae bacterium]
GDKTCSSNTRWALEDLEFAKEYHKEQEWVDAVYQSSFVQRQDIGDLHTLLDIAKSLELDTDKLRFALENHVYYRVLLRNDQYCMEQRLEFVPTIYSGDKILLEGVLTFDMVQDKIRMLAKK